MMYGFNQSNLKSGFRKAGAIKVHFYPYDPTAIKPLTSMEGTSSSDADAEKSVQKSSESP